MCAMSDRKHNEHGTTLAQVVWRNRKVHILKAMADFDIGPEHVHLSHRAAKARNAHGELSFEQQVCTTIALLIMLCHVACSSGKVADRQRGRAILSDWLREVLSGEQMSLDVTGALKEQLVDCDCAFRFEAGKLSQRMDMLEQSLG